MAPPFERGPLLRAIALDVECPHLGDYPGLDWLSPFGGCPSTSGSSPTLLFLPVPILAEWEIHTGLAGFFCQRY
jgi:hypothetical protein